MILPFRLQIGALVANQGQLTPLNNSGLGSNLRTSMGWGFSSSVHRWLDGTVYVPGSGLSFRSQSGITSELGCIHHFSVRLHSISRYIRQTFINVQNSFIKFHQRCRKSLWHTLTLSFWNVLQCELWSNPYWLRLRNVGHCWIITQQLLQVLEHIYFHEVIEQWLKRVSGSPVYISAPRSIQANIQLKIKTPELIENFCKSNKL